MVFGHPSSSSRFVRDLHGVRLRSALKNEEYEALTVDPETGSHGVLSRSEDATGNQIISVKQGVPFWRAIYELWRPKITKCQSLGDRSVVETVVNVATSLPFIAIGLQTPRTKPKTRLYGNSLVGVGVMSSMYHISRGNTRKGFRFGDYVMIAVASLCFNAALKDNYPKGLMLASALFIPVQPTYVTILQTGIMEATFVKRVMKEPKLRRAHNLHKLASVVGGVLFVADDMMPHTPFIHAAWHLAAATGIATSIKFLD